MAVTTKITGLRRYLNTSIIRNKGKVPCSSETSVICYHNTLLYISEGCKIYTTMIKSLIANFELKTKRNYKVVAVLNKHSAMRTYAVAEIQLH
jgi:hypothetical protein